MLRLILLFFDISLKKELTLFFGSVINAWPKSVFSFKNLFINKLATVIITQNILFDRFALSKIEMRHKSNIIKDKDLGFEILILDIC